MLVIQMVMIFKNPSGSCAQYNGTGMLNGYLVGADASSGKLVTSAQICENQYICPYDIQYWSGK